MPPKVTPFTTPSGSRQKVKCGHCDKEFERRNLKEHNAIIHGNMPVKEKPRDGQKTILFSAKSVINPKKMEEYLAK